MKKFLLFLTLLFCVLSLSGEGMDIKAHGRVSSRFTAVNGDFALLAGFNGVLVLNNVILGGGGYVLATDNNYECSQECIDSAGKDWDSSCRRETSGNIRESNLSLGYGGFIAGYQFNPVSFLDIELKGLIGGGRHSSYYYNYDFKVSFFVFEPELMLKLVLTKYVAVAFRNKLQACCRDGQ